MTREEIREHCNAYGYSDEEVGAFLDGMELGRADAEKELEELRAEIAELHCERQAESVFIKERDAEIRAEAIDEFKRALHTQFEQNKALAKRCSSGNRVKELALTNLDLEEIDEIAEQLKEQDK